LREEFKILEKSDIFIEVNILKAPRGRGRERERELNNPSIVSETQFSIARFDSLFQYSTNHFDSQTEYSDKNHFVLLRFLSEFKKFELLSFFYYYLKSSDLLLSKKHILLLGCRSQHSTFELSAGYLLESFLSFPFELFAWAFL